MMLSACNLVPAKVVRIPQGEASSAPAASGSPPRSRAVVKVSDAMIAIGD